MSIFECGEGHMVPHHKRYCPECGGPITRMDGKSARQLRAEAEEYEQMREAQRELEEVLA